MPSDRPNILLLVADQLSQQAVGAYGHRPAATPRIDRLASQGVRFERAYSPSPLCTPARAAFWTGLLPHATGVMSNGHGFPIPPLDEAIPTLGELFTGAGYQAVHFGKQGCGDALRGFDIRPTGKGEAEPEAPSWTLSADTFRDVHTTEQAVAFLDGEVRDPFIMVADLNNPHDICHWVGENAGPHEDVPLPEGALLPPLPDNFEIDDIERRPRPIQYLCCAHRRLAQAAGWSRENYRHYLAAYHHYVNRADRCIGRILDALGRSAAAEDTLIVFFSDHGDGMARHRMVTKHTSFYEQTVRVPLIFAGRGVAGAARGATAPLASLLDLVPTLCEAAGIDPPGRCHGRSLWPWVQSSGEVAEPPDAPGYVTAQWHTEWGHTIEPGRMIRTDRYKYTRFIEGEGEELYDLWSDPGEQRTLIDDPAHAAALQTHRRLLAECAERTQDPFFEMDCKADARWRSHPPGYPNHEGPAAPDAE